jgi:type VI protein secretion system component VasK
MSARRDHGDDLSARAMLALEGELVIPADLEARLFASIPALAEGPGDAAEARAVHRPPARPSSTSRRPALALALAAAFAIGVAAAGGAWWSAHRDERAAVARAEAAESAAARVTAIDWSDATDWRAKMAALEELREKINGLSSREATARLAPRYVDGVRRAFLDAARADLEAKLRAGAGDHASERDALETYRLLAAPERLHAEGAWEADHLTATSVETLASRTKLPADELRAMVRPHVVAWIFLVETEIVPAAEIDPSVVAAAEKSLNR